MSGTAYTKLREYSRTTGALGATASLAGWDQETYMPAGAAAGRAEQMALLAGLLHERKTSDEFRDLIAASEQEDLGGDDSPARRNVREMRRAYELSVRVPGELVSEQARVSSQAQQVWKDAKDKADFSLFAPWLDKAFGIARQMGECLKTDGQDEIYDALLDVYEPGAKATEIEAVFNPLRDSLSALIADIAQNGTHPGREPIQIRVPEERQHAFGLFVLESCGFDLNRGRLDTVVHPFCQDLGPGDVRLTTHYRENAFTDALYGTMHEMGHGLYEQGLPREGEDAHFGEPLGNSISLGIHESQSRLWENLVGRSLEFWRWAHPHAVRLLGDEIGRYSPEQLYAAVNTASPSLIRIEADEATYNLHVMVRFELERAMLRGELDPKDAGGAWRDRYKSYLGIDVPDDGVGVLQDVHWSHGLIGYFPTYTLGNIYASQWWQKIDADLGGVASQIERGEFAPLLTWLRENIHAHGMRFRAGELCERVTGQPMSSEPLLNYLSAKLRPIHGMG